jgi:hypothetical protein
LLGRVTPMHIQTNTVTPIQLIPPPPPPSLTCKVRDPFGRSNYNVHSYRFLSRLKQTPYHSACTIHCTRRSVQRCNSSYDLVQSLIEASYAVTSTLVHRCAVIVDTHCQAQTCLLWRWGSKFKRNRRAQSPVLYGTGWGHARHVTLAKMKSIDRHRTAAGALTNRGRTKRQGSTRYDRPCCEPDPEDVLDKGEN